LTLPRAMEITQRRLILIIFPPDCCSTRNNVEPLARHGQ
jgi:hypothetical protein